MIIRIATRGSRLALIQTAEVEERLRRLGYTTERVVVESHGDMDRVTPLYRMGVRGIFEKEVDRVVLEGEADIAVHSLKDVPYELPTGIILGAVPKRGAPFDALTPHPLYRIPPGSKVGTGSVRRMLTLRALRPDLKVEAIRGNVDTRLTKLLRGDFDALITAEVALRRLGVSGWFRLNPNFFVPSPGQGALGVTCRANPAGGVAEALRRLEHVGSRVEVEVERSIALRLGGGCTSPLGVYARHISASRLEVRISLVRSSGGLLRVKVRGDSKRIVDAAVRAFEAKGGILEVERWKSSPTLG
ncbi:MAG: hydroxymethylbilane synthase [Thermoprotei archaeon]